MKTLYFYMKEFLDTVLNKESLEVFERLFPFNIEIFYKQFYIFYFSSCFSEFRKTHIRTCLQCSLSARND